MSLRPWAMKVVTSNSIDILNNHTDNGIKENGPDKIIDDIYWTTK